MADSASPDRDGAPDIGREVARARERRAALQVDRPFATGDGQWGLALSGGGIRSATFCLGVMQGLSKSGPQPPGDSGPVGRAMLAQFDYLSTVSGGGYIGGFFSSLFANGRLNRKQELDDAQTARQAYRVFTEEPPQRLRHDVRFDPEHPGRAALAWLRENGRYMAPNGTGDMLYALAIHVRNWCATHYVLGIALLGLFSVLAFAHTWLIALADGSPAGSWQTALFSHERSLFEAALDGRAELGWSSIWWSAAWWLSIPILALWSLPTGIAFWFTQTAGEGKAAPPGRFPAALGVGVIVGLALIGLACFLRSLDAPWYRVEWLAGGAGAITLLGVAWYVVTAALAPSVATHRVLLTRRLKDSLVALSAMAALALIETAAQTVHLQSESLWKLGTPAAFLAALVWIARRIAEAANQKDRKGILARVPLGAVATVAGIALAFLVALLWAILVQWIRWNGEVPGPEAFASASSFAEAVPVLLSICLTAFILAVATGLFPGFLNLSTLQGLYSARLTRAYLGASASFRFEEGNEHLRSVAEPCPEDQLDVATLHGNPMAPMHLINVCLNQTADPGENLVQRDRKGRPLALVPGGIWLDQSGYPMPRPKGRSEIAAGLSVGDWIGISGAAFTTGLGRGTSLGMSLLLGLANVRLGRWWPTGIKSSPGRPPDTTLRRLFRTQFYLADEFLARFQGTRREWQYLSDGGHFENTAVYELLRPDREVSLIVCCDCGADPQYTFEDLANLTRLARIDFGIELCVDTAIAGRKELGQVFGTFADFQGTSGGPPADKCAVLVNVLNRVKSDGTRLPDARIVFLKPRVLSSSSIDIRHYGATHASFPQETTIDQFFDEAQWESYRRLGREVAMRVFPQPGDTSGYSKEFLEYFP